MSPQIYYTKRKKVKAVQLSLDNIQHVKQLVQGRLIKTVEGSITRPRVLTTGIELNVPNIVKPIIERGNWVVWGSNSNNHGHNNLFTIMTDSEFKNMYEP